VRLHIADEGGVKDRSKKLLATVRPLGSFTDLFVSFPSFHTHSSSFALSSLFDAHGGLTSPFVFWW
jgi:hypothetical protein